MTYSIVTWVVRQPVHRDQLRAQRSVTSMGSVLNGPTVILLQCPVAPTRVPSIEMIKQPATIHNQHRRLSLLGRAGNCTFTFHSLWPKPILCPPTFCGWKSIFCHNQATSRPMKCIFSFSFAKSSILSSANPTKMLLLKLLFWPWICTKSFVGWDFAPDLTGGAYSAPPDSLAAFKGTYF